MELTRRGALALIAAMAASPAAAAPGGRSRLDDLAYDERSGRNRLDIHRPQGKGPFPWLLDLHGGGFLTGDKRSLPVQPQVLARGIAVVRMNYRLSSEAIWPAQLDDVLAAAGFVREHADRFGLIGDRMALGGRSAGAFLAVSAGLSLAATDRPARAVVDFYGPMDFGSMDADMARLEAEIKRPPTDAARSVESQLIGYAVGSRRAEATAMSPVGRLMSMPPGTALPPLLIRHGARDTIVPAGQAERLRAAWHAVDPRAPIDFAILPDQGHGTAAFGRDKVLAPMARFLERHLTDSA